MKRFILLLCLLVLLLTGCKTIKQDSPKATSLAARLSGNVFTLEETEVKLNANYYLIYYSADWCPYCEEAAAQVRETSHLMMRMYDDIAFVLAGHKRDLSNDDVKRDLIKHEFEFPYLRFEAREESGLFDILGPDTFYIPAFILLDKEGNVLSSSNGKTKDDYNLMRPVQLLQSIETCDCVLEKLKESQQ